MFESINMASLTSLAVIASVLVQTFAFRLTPRLDGRIVGGQNANINDFLYQLSFQMYNSHICGASIISDKTALTAAHCTDGMSTSGLTVRAGSTYHDFAGQVLDVSIIFQHPYYDSFQTDYDASVLRLQSLLYVGISISLQPIGAEVSVGALAVVTGWGTTSSGGSIPSDLKQVNVAHISDDECRSAYGSQLTSRMTCYGSPGKDSCQGDSGGPLVYNDNQVGIVSWGYGCADPSYPGIYAKVSESSIHDHITTYML